MAIFSPNKHRNGNLQRMLPPVGWLTEVQARQICTTTQSQVEFPVSSGLQNKIPCNKCQPGHFWLLLSAYINSASSDLSCPSHLRQRPCLRRTVSPGRMRGCHRSSVSAPPKSFPAWIGTVKVRTVTAPSPHLTFICVGCVCKLLSALMSGHQSSPARLHATSALPACHRSL